MLFRSSLDWLNQEDATASVWKGYFNVSPRSSLFAHQEGAFSGCYQVRSLGMAFMKNYTNKEIKLNRTAASFNNFFKYWWEYKIPRIILVFKCLSLSNNNECLQQQQQQLYLYPTLIYMHETKKLERNMERVQATHNSH